MYNARPTDLIVFANTCNGLAVVVRDGQMVLICEHHDRVEVLPTFDAVIARAKLLGLLAHFDAHTERANVFVDVLLSIWDGGVQTMHALERDEVEVLAGGQCRMVVNTLTGAIRMLTPERIFPMADSNEAARTALLFVLLPTSAAWDFGGRIARDMIAQYSLMSRRAS